MSRGPGTECNELLITNITSGPPYVKACQNY